MANTPVLYDKQLRQLTVDVQQTRYSRPGVKNT